MRTQLPVGLPLYRKYIKGTDLSQSVIILSSPSPTGVPTLKHRPQHRAEDTESPERLRQQISIINATKCAATAVLHQKAEQGLVAAAHTAVAIRMVKWLNGLQMSYMAMADGWGMGRGT
eukprot:jgi/Chrzof1/6261/Cz17g17240.t1